MSGRSKHITIREEYVGLIVIVHMYVTLMQRLSKSRQWAAIWSLKEARVVRRAVSALPRRALVGSCVESHCITVLSVLLSYINARLTPICVSTYVKVWLAPENSTSSPLYCPEQSEENSSAIRQLSCSVCSSHFSFSRVLHS